MNLHARFTIIYWGPESCRWLLAANFFSRPQARLAIPKMDQNGNLGKRVWKKVVV